MTTEATSAAAPAAPEATATAPAPPQGAPDAAATVPADGQRQDQAPETTVSEPGADAAETERKKRSENSTSYWRRQAEKERRARDQLIDRILSQQDRSAQPAAQPSQAAPKPEDYADFDQYLMAKAEHAILPKVKQDIMQELESRQRQAADAAERQRREETAAAFQANMEKASERYADFDDVAARVFSDGFPVTPAMAEAVAESEHSGDLVYYLGSHPDEAARIARMTPFAAARAIGRLEAKLQAPARRATTQAPPPPPTVKGSSAPAPDIAALAKKDDATELITLWRSQKKA